MFPEPLRANTASVPVMTAIGASENTALALVGSLDPTGSWLSRLTTPVFERLCLRWLAAVGISDLDLRDQWGTGLVEGTGVLAFDDQTTDVIVRCVGDTRPMTAADVRNLRLVLGRHGERGLFVTAGVITDEARAAATSAGEMPILLVDGTQFLDCLTASGDVVCHEPSNTWMVVDRDGASDTELPAQDVAPVPVAV